MSKRQIDPCVHGGGEACERQGGSGVASHGAGYVHPYPTVQELGLPAGDPVAPVQKSEVRTLDLNLETFFDEDLSKSVLDIHVHTSVDVVDMVRKSLFDFNLDDDQGVRSLLELLPVLDTVIMQDIAGEIWPGYPTQEADPKLLRAEVRGYLMDWLDGHGQE